MTYAIDGYDLLLLNRERKKNDDNHLSEISGQLHFASVSQRPQETGVAHKQIQAADGHKTQSEWEKKTRKILGLDLRLKLLLKATKMVKMIAFKVKVVVKSIKMVKIIGSKVKVFV